MDRARALASRIYGVRAVDVRELPSYLDRNFLLIAEDGARHVLKVAHAGEDRRVLEAQHSAMEHLAACGLAVPRVVDDPSGETLHVQPGPDGARHLVRLVTYLPGRRLVEVPHPPALLEDLGAFLGELDRALADFDHPALHRPLRWDLERAPDVREHLEAIAGGDRRERVAAHLERFRSEVLPRLQELRHTVVHNDANDHNVLVGGDPPRVVGLIDFGDLVHTATVCELAIALTYVMLDEDDPLAAALPVVRGYHARHPLEADEVELLPDLVETRLCVSVTLSAHGRRQRPENDYVNVTEAHAWPLLDRLRALDRAQVDCALHGACRDV